LISGLLVLNKPSGISSGEFIRKLKPFLDDSKIGHSGTLDPLASGVILACLGQMTRFTNFLANEKKTYIAEMMFGIKTDTGDLDGKIEKELKKIPTKNDFKKTAKEYIGKIDQEAPKYSSLKHKGKPLYHYARKNKEVPKKIREIEIFKLDLISIDQNKFKFLVECGKGTYIRSLINDLAEDLDCVAVLSNLQRTNSANHDISEAYEIESINSENIKNKIIQMGDALRCIDKIQCATEIIDRLKKGQKIYLKEAETKSKYLRLFDKKNKFIGILENINGLVSPKRLISIEN
tara:strand:- start:653 stop:1525 length:873 start_codon:yes stop_codon:yes gene_type:complete